MMMKPVLTNEAELVQQLIEGSQRAFSKLYAGYFALLYAHAYNRLRIREEAEDVVQEVFTTLWAKRENLQIKKDLLTYLHSAVRNRVVDVISRKALQNEYFQNLILRLETSEDNTDHLIRERQLLEMVRAEIDRMSPQVKKVFELSRMGHLSHKQIANNMGLPETTVRTYMKRALRILRSKFGIWVIGLFFGL